MHRRHLTSYIAAALLAASSVCLAHASPRDGDPAAYALLKQAHDNRSAFPASLSGLTADVAVNDNGAEFTGALTYNTTGDVTLHLSGASTETQQWAHDELESALAHRRSEDFAHGDGSHAITFAPDDHSPLGRKVLLNDGMNSSYRVKDGRLTEVNRSMGPMNFTITMMADRTVDGDRYLPSQFIVTYFAPGGAIQRVDAFTDEYARVAGAWVPSYRRVVTAEKGGFTTRSIALSHVKLLNQAARR